jgi:hypothetical protein
LASPASGGLLDMGLRQAAVSSVGNFSGLPMIVMISQTSGPARPASSGFPLGSVQGLFQHAKTQTGEKGGFLGDRQHLAAESR